MSNNNVIWWVIRKPYETIKETRERARMAADNETRETGFPHSVQPYTADTYIVIREKTS
jgi:hypothetical protein